MINIYNVYKLEQNIIKLTELAIIYTNYSIY